MQLGTSVEELDFLCRAIHDSPERLFHSWEEPKRSGGVRAIDAPQGRLRRILDRLQQQLRRIAVPDCLHGGVPKRSNATNAENHTGKAQVVTMDIADFYPSVTSKRVYEIFHVRLGCSPDIARYLTRLTTVNGHLPQGTPTSPLLAVLASEHMAKRLKTLADQFGLTFSLYVDDITCSGRYEFPISFITYVEKIAQQEGFTIKQSKTRIMKRADEQIVTGLVVNKTLDIPVEKFEEVNAAVNTLPSPAVVGDESFHRLLRSLQGKLRYWRRFSPGKANILQKKLEEKLRKLNHPISTV